MVASSGLALSATKVPYLTSRSVRLRCSLSTRLPPRTPYHVTRGVEHERVLLTSLPHLLLVGDDGVNGAVIGVCCTMEAPADLTPGEWREKWEWLHMRALSGALVSLKGGGQALHEWMLAIMMDRGAHRQSKSRLSPSSLFPVHAADFHRLDARYNEEMERGGVPPSALRTFFIHPSGRKHPLLSITPTSPINPHSLHNVSEGFVAQNLSSHYHLRSIAHIQLTIGEEVREHGHTLYWRQSWIEQERGRTATSAPRTRPAAGLEGKEEAKEDVDVVMRHSYSASSAGARGQAEAMQVEAAVVGGDEEGEREEDLAEVELGRGVFYPHVFVEDAANYQSTSALPCVVPPLSISGGVPVPPTPVATSFTLYNTAAHTTVWSGVEPYSRMPFVRPLYCNQPMTRAEAVSVRERLLCFKGALAAERRGGRYGALRMETTLFIPLTHDAMAVMDTGEEGEVGRMWGEEQRRHRLCVDALTSYLHRSTALLQVDTLVGRGAVHMIDSEELWTEHKEPIFIAFASLVWRMMEDRTTTKGVTSWPAERLLVFDFALHQLQRLATHRGEASNRLLSQLERLCVDEGRVGLPLACVSMPSPFPASQHFDEVLSHLRPIHVWAAHLFPNQPELLRRHWLTVMTRRCLWRGSMCTPTEKPALRSQLDFSWALSHHLYESQQHGDQLSALLPLYTSSLRSLIEDAAHRLRSQRKSSLPRCQPEGGKWGLELKRRLIDAKVELVEDGVRGAVSFFVDILDGSPNCFLYQKATSRWYAHRLIHADVRRRATSSLHGFGQQVISAARRQAAETVVAESKVRVFLDVSRKWSEAPQRWIRFRPLRPSARRTSSVSSTASTVMAFPPSSSIASARSYPSSPSSGTSLSSSASTARLSLADSSLSLLGAGYSEWDTPMRRLCAYLRGIVMHGDFLCQDNVQDMQLQLYLSGERWRWLSSLRGWWPRMVLFAIFISLRQNSRGVVDLRPVLALPLEGGPKFVAFVFLDLLFANKCACAWQEGLDQGEHHHEVEGAHRFDDFRRALRKRVTSSPCVKALGMAAHSRKRRRLEDGHDVEEGDDDEEAGRKEWTWRFGVRLYTRLFEGGHSLVWPDRSAEEGNVRRREVLLSCKATHVGVGLHGLSTEPSPLIALAEQWSSDAFGYHASLEDNGGQRHLSRALRVEGEELIASASAAFRFTEERDMGDDDT